MVKDRVPKRGQPRDRGTGEVLRQTTRILLVADELIFLHTAAQLLHRLGPSKAVWKGTLDAMKRGGSLQAMDTCALSNCPRLMAYKESLDETITALKKTGNAFKSGNFRELSKNPKQLPKRPG